MFFSGLGDLFGGLIPSVVSFFNDLFGWMIGGSDGGKGYNVDGKGYALACETSASTGNSSVSPSPPGGGSFAPMQQIALEEKSGTKVQIANLFHDAKNDYAALKKATLYVAGAPAGSKVKEWKGETPNIKITGKANSDKDITVTASNGIGQATLSGEVIDKKGKSLGHCNGNNPLRGGGHRLSPRGDTC